MTKLCCLPVEATNYMVEMGGKQSLRPALTYAAMLAAAPPPPPEIEVALAAALELVAEAKAVTRELMVAKALLQSWGRE